jgi:phosphomannomutase
VSTDGDADRPLVADGAGQFHRGDLVGAIAPRFLGADAIVTLVTSNSAVDVLGAFERVIRTRVGSPYVIERMEQAARSGARKIIGFEANGGVLASSDFSRPGRTPAALPTRDAMLPILCVLGEVNARGKSLAKIGAGFAFMAAASAGCRTSQARRVQPFISRLKSAQNHVSGLFEPLGGAADMNEQDGLRIKARNGEVVHVRASGNAPELRVYSEAKNEKRAASLLEWGVAAAPSHKLIAAVAY